MPKTDRRERARIRARYGMRVVGRSVRDMIAPLIGRKADVAKKKPPPETKAEHSDAYYEAPYVPPVVKGECFLCEEPIVEGEALADTNLPAHKECMLRSITGGIEHLTAPPDHPVGSCYRDSTLTYRESSIAAAEWVEQHGIEAAFEWRGGHEPIQ